VRARGAVMNAAGTLGELALARGWRHRPAFHVADTTTTHGQVHGLAARLAGVLADRGIAVGSRVLIAGPDGAEWVALFLAIGRVGAVSILVNPALAADEQAAVVEQARPDLVVVGTPQEVFGGRRAVSTDELGAEARRAPATAAVPVDGSAPLYVQYSSGTTGPPKGAVHRHRDLAAHHRAVGREVLHIAADDVSLSMSKLYFAYGFGNSLIYPLLSGSAAVLLPGRPTPQLVEEAAARHHVTVLHGVPSGLANLVAEAGAAAFEHVRVAVSAGEGLPSLIGRRTSELVGAPVLDELGSTEVGGAFCSNRVDDNVEGTVGRPLAGFQIVVRNRTGRSLDDGVEGRLRVRGPTLPVEYLDRPDATADAMSDGWLVTNDTGYRRADGRFVHTGRADDVELVGGVNVAPSEVEAVLARHAAVREVAVAAVPNARGATKLRAYVVATGADHDAGTLEAELIALAGDRLTATKVPRTVSEVDALPRTASGKLRRHVVRTGRW